MCALCPTSSYLRPRLGSAQECMITVRRSVVSCQLWCGERKRPQSQKFWNSVFFRLLLAKRSDFFGDPNDEAGFCSATIPVERLHTRGVREHQAQILKRRLRAKKPAPLSVRWQVVFFPSSPGRDTHVVQLAPPRRRGDPNL